MWEKMNSLEKSFRILGILEIIGGIILGFVTAPGDPGIGMIWKIAAYYGTIICLVAGIMFGLIFIAVSNGLYYLRSTMEINVEIISEIRAGNSRMVEMNKKEIKKEEIDPPTISTESIEESGLTKTQIDEANELRRFYGKSAYDNFIERKIKENKSISSSTTNDK